MVPSRVQSSDSSSSTRPSAALAITSRARISSSSSSVPSSMTPRRRISHGSVRPCPTTVTRISAKVMNWISSRPGSGSPASVFERQRQRRGQRDRAAHARPAADDAEAPARAARALRGAPVERPDERRDDEVPQEADRDHRRADRGRVADHLARRQAAEAVDDRRQLQADQDEEGGVEQEGEDRPHPVGLHPALRRGDLGRAPAEVDAAGDRGQDARDAELVGRHERPVGAEQRDRELGVDVGHALPDLGDRPADRQPDRDPPAGVDQELEHGVARRDARRRPPRPPRPCRRRARWRR